MFRGRLSNELFKRRTTVNNYQLGATLRLLMQAKTVDKLPLWFSNRSAGTESTLPSEEPKKSLTINHSFQLRCGRR